MATSGTDLPRKHKLSVSDYCRLAKARSLRETDRVELIDGEGIINSAPKQLKLSAVFNALPNQVRRISGLDSTRLRGR